MIVEKNKKRKNCDNELKRMIAKETQESYRLLDVKIDNIIMYLSFAVATYLLGGGAKNVPLEFRGFFFIYFSVIAAMVFLGNVHSLHLHKKILDGNKNCNSYTECVNYISMVLFLLGMMLFIIAIVMYYFGG